MNSQRSTPILIIGFNRPKTLESLVLEVEKLPEREIWISIDGPRDELDKKQIQETITCVASWSRNSKHSIRIFEQVLNLGIYKHCVHALSLFFTEFSVGIILEDDIQFRPEFISYVDQNRHELESGKYWSFCGHNPVKDLSKIAESHSIKFSRTYVHTIWGWASNRESVSQFLQLVNHGNSNEMNDSIAAGARMVTRDPFVRIGVRKVWQSKLQRALRAESGGGWDNFWIIAGWRSGLPSLMPSYSLARENPLQLEGQSHAHEIAKEIWPSSSIRFGVEPLVVGSQNISDAVLLKVWGITRLYCWFYSIRIFRWKIDGSS